MPKTKPVDSLLDRDPVDLREELLKAAAGLFMTFGIERTRITDIADAARTSRPNVYQYFPGGKSELVATVELIIVRRVYDQIAARVPIRGDARKVLANYVMASIEDGLRDPYTLMLLRSDAARWTSRFVAQSDELHQLMVDVWEPILDYAQGRGQLVEGLDRDRAIRWLGLVMNACVTTPEIVRNRDDLVYYVEHHIVPSIVTSPVG